MWCVSPDCRLSGRFSLVYGVWVQGVEWGHVSDLFFAIIYISQMQTYRQAGLTGVLRSMYAYFNVSLHSQCAPSCPGCAHV